MSFFQYLGIAWENVVHRKKRAYLTIIGVFIGIMAVVALVSLGRGLEAGVNAEFSKLGVDKIFVQPASAFGGGFIGVSPRPFGDEELKGMRRTSGISEAFGTVFGSAKVEWGDELGFYYVIAAPSEHQYQTLYEEAFQTDVVEGRQLESQDVYKVVVGYDYTRRDVFQKTLDIGSTVQINGVTFSVVGIRKRIGNPDDDRSVFVSDKARDLVFPAKIGTYDYLIGRTVPSADPAAVADTLTEKLRSVRDVKAGDEDFSVQTADDIREQFNTILAIIQFVLTGVAAISLLVGSVGIMNTMYTAVLERTKEIGVMKAIGATNRAIMSIFLLESGMLGLFGAAVGVILGLIISYATSVAAANFLGNNLIQFYVSYWLVLGALAFGFVVGGLAGFLPARQAAAMNPVDSLRYE